MTGKIIAREQIVQAAEMLAGQGECQGLQDAGAKLNNASSSSDIARWFEKWKKEQLQDNKAVLAQLGSTASDLHDQIALLAYDLTARLWQELNERIQAEIELLLQAFSKQICGLEKERVDGIGAAEDLASQLKSKLEQHYAHARSLLASFKPDISEMRAKISDIELLAREREKRVNASKKELIAAGKRAECSAIHTEQLAGEAGQLRKELRARFAEAEEVCQIALRASELAERLETDAYILRSLESHLAGDLERTQARIRELEAALQESSQPIEGSGQEYVGVNSYQVQVKVQELTYQTCEVREGTALDSEGALTPSEPLANDIQGQVSVVEVQQERQESQRGDCRTGASGSTIQAASTETCRARQQSERESARGKLRKYQALASRPAGDRISPASIPASAAEVAVPPRSSRALSIEVRLVFEKGGSCTVSLLPQRIPELPEEMLVSGSGCHAVLLALQDEWFQDIVPEGLGALLREGVAWEADQGTESTTRWVLSGREVFVLGAQPGLRGYVSQPRLVLGAEHIVLCAVERLNEVLAVIEEAGSSKPAVLGGSFGVPEGWLALRGVIPQWPLSPNPVADILNILRPIASAEISLQGGIRIGRSIWLAGYPPEIRLRGSAIHFNQVLIDGQIAELCEGATYTAPGWDAIGSHIIWSGGQSRSYSIQHGREEWKPWDTFAFPATASQQFEPPIQIALCGVLVSSSFDQPDERHSILTRAENPMLIGSVPGQVFRCSKRRDLHGFPCFGIVPFDPIWALPENPLLANKATACVRLAGELLLPAAVHGPIASTNREDRKRLLSWYSLILDAARKGLQVEPNRPDAIALWHAYKKYARGLWRTHK